MAVSSQAQQFIDMLRAGKNPNQGQERPDPEKTLAEREALRKNADRMQEIMPEEITVEPVQDGTVRGEWHHNRNKKEGEKRILYFIYGGGFETGSVESRRWTCAKIAAALGTDAFAVSYRQWPEAMHPAALQDCSAAFDWLMAKGYAPEDILLFGESAGASLCLTTTCYRKDYGMAVPAKVSVFSPVINLRGDYPSREERDAIDPMIGKDSKANYFTKEDETDPYAAAQYADFAGFPKLQILGGTNEVLFDDAEHLFDLAKKAGVDCRRKAYEGMFHSFILFPCPETDEAVQEIADFLKN